MKLSHLATATAAFALMGGAAYAQTPMPPHHQMPPAESTTRTDTTGQVNPMPADGSTTSATATTSTDVTAPVASSATTYGAGVSVTTTTLTNGPVPDTAENRAKYGSPMSNAGKRTAAKGN